MSTKAKAILNILVVTAISVALLLGMNAITDTILHRQQDDEARSVFGQWMKTDQLEALATDDREVVIAAWKAADSAGTHTGYALTMQVDGYGGAMTVHVALSPDGGTFLGVQVGANRETQGYGSRAADPAYTNGFAGKAAPLSLGGYTGLEDTADEAAPADAPLRDGTYHVEEASYSNGYKPFLDLTVQGGRITAVNWDAYKEDSGLTKKEESERGLYIMTQDGKRWHEQAAIMEQALIQAGSPDAIVYQPTDGKTDAYAGVSISVGDFVRLAKQAVENAQGGAVAAPSGTAVDSVSGATVTSKAIVRAANLAYAFVKDRLS